MKKILLFFLIIIISISDIFFLNKAFETDIEYAWINSTQDNRAAIILTPVIVLFVIFIVTIINLICGITGLLYLHDVKIQFNYIFYTKTDSVGTKLLKIIGYSFIFLYLIIFIQTIIYPDAYGCIFSLLATCITILYLIWFTGVNKGFQIKEQNKTFIDIE